MSFYNVLLAQIVGIFIIIFNFLGDLQKCRKKILFYNTIINILCVIQYFLLNAYTGMFCCMLALLRNFVVDRTKGVSNIFILFYIMVVLCVSIPFVYKFMDVIPIINSVVFSIAITRNSVLSIRRANILTGLLGIIYDFTSFAFTGLLLNFMDFVSGTIYVFKEKLKR